MNTIGSENVTTVENRGIEMNFKKNIKYGASGSDVLWIKQALFELGYYDTSVKAVVKQTFGKDTLAAVKAFQRENVDADGKKLRVDGIVGIKTWDAIAALQQAVSEITITLPANIGPRAAASIGPDLMRVGETRRKMALHALSFAYDPLVPAQYPYSLYIWGGNLYNADLKINAITAARIESGTKQKPEYYNNGRKDMMLAAVRADPGISGADCSGAIVGLMRRFELVKPTFDTTADLMASRYSSVIKSSELRPGDWVGRPGHIGIFVGGGYVVEWMGGQYGCQLSQLTKRQGYGFVSRKMENQKAWTRYRRPDAY